MLEKQYCSKFQSNAVRFCIVQSFLISLAVTHKGHRSNNILPIEDQSTYLLLLLPGRCHVGLLSTSYIDQEKFIRSKSLKSSAQPPLCTVYSTPDYA